jgi:two-component system chemotaxis response regulator CheB
MNDTPGRRIRVLIVDDSAIVRRVLTDTLAVQPDIEVVGVAPAPDVARKKIAALSPDVITLDIEMPGMDGITFLREIMRERPMPVIIISSLAQGRCGTVMDALEAGAVEVLPKPGGPYSVGDLRLVLPDKVRAAAQTNIPLHARLRSATRPPAQPTPATMTTFHGGSLIAIGASTGGTEAIRVVLEGLPPDSPPVLIVQHIPPVFSRAFADRLDRICAVKVREAASGDRLQRGLALIAPGDYHLLLRKANAGPAVELKQGPRVCYQRPSVDVLFHSIADTPGVKPIGVILTGMGNDGASGLLKLREAGAPTIGQDERTCAVYGMPKEAARIGAVQHVVPLPRIANTILQLAGRPATGPGHEP